jgi:NTP pyrophosphatase (non-canonical NTP hydrolase)
MSEKMFPVLQVTRKDGSQGLPTSVPWSKVEPLRLAALRGHQQTLERLAERGGLTVAELYGHAHGIDLQDFFWKRKEEFYDGDRLKPRVIDWFKGFAAVGAEPLQQTLWPPPVASTWDLSSVLPLTLDAYQADAARTLAMPLDSQLQLAVLALGLTGEAGEVADLLKKELGHGHDADDVKLSKELGDVLWYIAALASKRGLSLSCIAQGNIDKLKARYPDGFSHEASKNRNPDDG